jgi:hypothetical protein
MLQNNPIKSVTGDMDRRWLTDDYFDLILWYDAAKRIHGFQLCYDKSRRERALTWTVTNGFLHSAVDGGESKPTTNRTPILLADPVFSSEEVMREFCARSELLSQEICDLVLGKIAEYDQLRHAVGASDASK